MFTKMASSLLGDGYMYKSEYYSMYDAGGDTPAEGTKTYTATEDCIVELNLTLTKISSIFPYAYISINNVQLRHIQNTTGVFKEIFHLNTGDTLTVRMRSYNTGGTVNYLNILTQFTP